MNKYSGVEWCPYCESESNYDVGEDTWIVPCQTCGRPLVLCDKCYTINGTTRLCEHCEHCLKANSMIREWKKNIVGKRVYWNDPDRGLCSCECTIMRFNDDCGTFSLRNDRGGFIEANEWELVWTK